MANDEKKNKDIFGLPERKDKTAVAAHPSEGLVDNHEGESAVPRYTRTLERKIVKKEPMFALEKAIRKDAEAVEPPKEMPNNEVKPPKKKKEE